MKKILSKFKFLFVFSLLLLIYMGIEVKASSLSISTSATSVSPGESFTVTVSVSNGAGNVTTTVSNGTGSMTDWLDNSSYSFTCTAGSSGTVSISASGTVADYTTEEDESKSASASVSIVDTSTASSVSTDTSSSTSSTSATTTTTSTSAPTLYNLGIDPYDFSGFSSSVTSYSVTVPNECTSVSIYAYSNNGTVTGTGTVTLSEGTNKFTVTVSNSSGSTAYTLSIIRETLDGDDVANSIEGDTEETGSEGIGLAGLTITGYTLEPEFDISTYEYTVTVDEELTLEDLEEIKDKVTAITNTDSVYTEITAGISEDGIATITIIVKDDEKEYSVYTIYFEQAVTAVASVSSSNEIDYDSLMDMEFLTKKVYLIIGCLIATIVIALFYAFISYKKSKYIEKYIMENDEDKDDDEDEEEEENFEELVEKFKEDDFEDNMDVQDLSIVSDEEENKVQENEETDMNVQNKNNEIKDSREYKKPRRNSSLGGKH